MQGMTHGMEITLVSKEINFVWNHEEILNRSVSII